MKKALLSVSTEKSINIGDYIQALASSQFLDNIDLFIEREKLKDYNDEDVAIIMNGWYMLHPEQWPPSPKIHPLFVAFHINSLAKDKLLSENSINYLKKYEPIGCRDTYTRDLLISKGVDAYFSACMTLTLGYSYKSEIREDKCYFVDPFIPNKKSLISKISNIIYLVFNWRKISIIANKLPYNQSNFRNRIIASKFYKHYIKIFTKETLLNAEYISQQNIFYKKCFSNDNERLKEAERLVKKYAKAKLVVTSRIHCALPCLGLETPIIYTQNSHQSVASSCRLGGLKELFNIIDFDKNSYSVNFKFNRKDRISITNTPQNKNLWKEYAHHLINTCKKFVCQQ